MALRIPAIIPAKPRPAQALHEDPSRRVEVMFRRVWETAMHDLPFVNPALSISAIGFRRVQGDWIGVAVTPWSINLLLLPGGGELWQDVATGEHRQLAFPAGPLEFIADNDTTPDAPISAYQYCPLITPVQHIGDDASARAAAEAILSAIYMPPPIPERQAHEGSETHEAPPPDSPVPSRRAFLRARAKAGR